MDPYAVTYMFGMMPVTYELSTTMPGIDQALYERAWYNYTKTSGYLSPIDFLRKFGVESTDLLRKITVAYGTTNVPNITEVMTVYGRCWKPDVEFRQLLQSA